MAFIDIFNFKKYFSKPSDSQVARYGHVNALYDQLSNQTPTKEYYSFILKITLDLEDTNYATYDVFYSDLAEGSFNDFSVDKINSYDFGTDTYTTSITVLKNNDSIADFTNVTLLTSFSGNGVPGSIEATSFQIPAQYQIAFTNPLYSVFNTVVWLEFRVYPNLL